MAIEIPAFLGNQHALGQGLEWIGDATNKVRPARQLIHKHLVAGIGNDTCGCLDGHRALLGVVYSLDSITKRPFVVNLLKWVLFLCDTAKKQVDQ